MIKKFAKTVYVYRHLEDTIDECLQVCETPEESTLPGEKRLVGVYELKETVIVEVQAKITKQKRN